jgi:cobalt-zinc-cadmium efflux system outer membrane protein
MLKSTRAALFAGALLGWSQLASAETVTLDEAIARASEAAPIIRADDAAVAAARAGRQQAGVRPNPSVTVEAENFIGSGPYDIFRQAEITATYSQPIERGGKRDARISLAERDVGVAQASARVTRLELAAQVQRAFLDVLITDEVVKIAEYRLSVERGMEREALRRVRGYKDPLFVETRAAARVAQAKIGVDQAHARQRAARAALAAFWGGNAETLEVNGELMRAGAVPALSAADQQLAEAKVARASAAVTVEQSRRVQDYTVSGGTRFLRGTNDVALVAGVTIPIGRFNRNQGNIEQAQAERLRLELTAEANRLDRLRRLASLRADADAARDRAQAIEREVYPRTTHALAQVREGYNRGGFSFRDMQDAADAILASQDRWLEAIIQYRDLQTEIDRLTGRFDTEVGSEVGELRP